MTLKGINKILFGGDYNPEQWDKSIIDEDIKLFKKAGIDIVTLNVFAWAMLQKSEDEYDFSFLDYTMDKMRQNDIKVCLATSTAAHPAWMAKKYPDILRTDFYGRKRKFGLRHNSCPNSQTYRKYSAELAGRLAERYKDYDNLVMWHISNEYGGECYCENCEKEFRRWLKAKYKTLDALNKSWNTFFWGHTFYDWDEIVLPNILSEHSDENSTAFEGITLDYRRFNSDSMLSCFNIEAKEIKKHTPDIPITTNLMGFYKTLDYQKWAKSMDFISWDNYPFADTPFEEVAMSHELMRSLLKKPFSLMEQTPSVTNWQDYNPLKRPGVMRLLSYQAIAHGADTVMYFQLRRSRGACEKMHGAVIDHVGSSQTRVFKECAELGGELKALGDTFLGADTKSKVGLLFDWDNWWATELCAGPTKLKDYKAGATRYYKALNNLNISTDIISVEDNLSDYKLIIAPMLYMIKDGFSKKLKKFVSGGGTLITTYMSGMTDCSGLVTTLGYPGELRELLGVWVEETDALMPFCENTIITKDFGTYPAYILCDVLHAEGAKAIAKYGKEFYADTPVITKNHFGKGCAYYVATSSNYEFYNNFLEKICKELKISPVMKTPYGVEATKRFKGKNEFTFLLNHTGAVQSVVLDKSYRCILKNKTFEAGHAVSLNPYDVMIITPVKDKAKRS